MGPHPQSSFCYLHVSSHGLILKNEIRNGQIPGSYGIDHEKIHEDSKKKIEDEVIKAYNCQDGGKASARISLTPPPKCNRADGSAYETPKMKRAQILEKVKKIPVNVTICMVKFRVNVVVGIGGDCE